MKMDKLFHKRWQYIFFGEKLNKKNRMEIFLCWFTLKNSTHEMLNSYLKTNFILAQYEFL